MDLNKAMIIGRLTRDPEMRATPNGINVCTFSVATNTSFGQGKDIVEYHNVVVWRKLAEIANQYLKKGSQVYIEGRIQTRSWQGNDGQKKNRTEIVADNLIMLGSKSGASKASASSEDFISQDELPTINQPQSSSSDEEITVEDIPF